MDPSLIGTASGLFMSSVAVGLAIAAPVGQIGVLAIQRTLQHGRVAGLATGLGAALADAVYGAIGAFGVTGLISWLVRLKPWLAWVGGAFLLVLAWRIARQPVGAVVRSPAARGSWWPWMAGTFVLTLSNPSTILSFLAIFSALAGRSAQPLASASPWLMVAGVLIGSALWWVFLAFAVGALRQRFDHRWQRAVNLGSAMLLVVMAVWPLVGMVRG